MNAWDSIWERFVAVVDRLDARLQPNGRGFVSRVERNANDVFPLRALVSYSPVGSPGDERLVISVDFQRVSGMVVGRADLARGDGSMLADEEILAPQSEGGLTTSLAEIDAVSRRVEAFVTHQYERLATELRD
jgi:hypothetical protein